METCKQCENRPDCRIYGKCKQGRQSPLSPSSAFVPVVVDPAYSEFFVKARIAAKENGYALAMHGSGIRDLDLIAIPWTDESRSPTNLIEQVKYRADCETNGHPVTEHKHGRLSVVFMINAHFSDPRYVDFSIIPPKEQNARAEERQEAAQPTKK